MSVSKSKQTLLALVVVAVAIIAAILIAPKYMDDHSGSELPAYTISGETDLSGNFYISFVYSNNIIMLDGKGERVWYLHEDAPDNGVHTGFWDFKKHVIDGRTYYSYHDQNEFYDKYGLEGYAPGERVILDSNFKEVKRISFEASDTVEKGHPLDGHDFILIDLDHYIMSGFIKDRVYNIEGYPDGSNVIYSYLQEVKDGEVVWDWRSIDYPELYSIVSTDATPTANDFANEQVDAPDYVHFNAMRINDDGDLVCSFRHLNTIMCLDRTKDTDQIKWKLSGLDDMFGLTEEQKTSGQHYVTVDGNNITVFDNHNPAQATRICSYDLDFETMTLTNFKEYAVEGRFTSACGSAQHLYDEVYVLGWGHTVNDAKSLSVYDFATDTELLSMTLDNPDNFTYRCVYYE